MKQYKKKNAIKNDVQALPGHQKTHKAKKSLGQNFLKSILALNKIIGLLIKLKTNTKNGWKMKMEFWKLYFLKKKKHYQNQSVLLRLLK